MLLKLKVTNFHKVSSRGQGYSKLHVESLGGSLLLPVQHILLWLLEVFLGHLREKKVECESAWKRILFLTFILLSLRARRPASVQIALMSAPERSSWNLKTLIDSSLYWLSVVNYTFDMMYSSRSTSSARVIFPDKKHCNSWAIVSKERRNKRATISQQYFNLCGCQRFCAWSSRLEAGTQFSWGFFFNFFEGFTNTVFRSNILSLQKAIRDILLRGKMWTISPVNSARPDQGRVKGLDSIGCHDHLKCCNVPIFLSFHNLSWSFEKRSNIQQWPWCHCAHQIHPTGWGVPTLSAESLFLRRCCCRTWDRNITTNFCCGILHTHLLAHLITTNLLVPTASISSMKTILGLCSSATLNSSRTSLGPSPRYFWISSLPTW